MSEALDRVRFTISVSPSHLRGGIDLLATAKVRKRLAAVAHRIHDINFTHHIEPLTRDAHGVFLTADENEAHLRQLLSVQEDTGITVTPVFNNVLAPNTYDALRQFVRGLEPLVERGIRSISVPHVLWLKMGSIQRAFPDLTLKNTVLRRVRTGQDLWNHAEAGFDYINIDRVLVRDRGALRELAQARQAFEDRYGRRVVLSMLDAEGCLGACALWEEHYQHTLTHPRTDENLDQATAVFREPQQYSCMAIGHPWLNFPMSVGLPWFREDLEEVCAYFDVIKLAGRKSFLSLGDCLHRVETFGQSDDDLRPGAPDELRQALSDPDGQQAVAAWRSAIKACRFQCWRCSRCAELIACMH